VIFLVYPSFTSGRATAHVSIEEYEQEFVLFSKSGYL